MAYLSATQAISLLPAAAASITGSSVPLNLGEVDTISDRVSAELDAAAAAAGYTVPVSTGASVARLQMAQWAQYGVGWLVLRTLLPNIGGPGDRASVAAEYRDAYQNALKMLRDGQAVLVGADIDTGSSVRQLPRSWETSHSWPATPMVAAGYQP